MAHLAYFRVSTTDQTIESQREALRQGGVVFEKEFLDAGVSGAVLAGDRAGFKALMEYCREGDTIHAYSVDRLGRDAIDVQRTVRDLLAKGVSVNIHGLGVIGKGVGELILAVLAQVASMERDRINERTQAGRVAAKESLARTGKTHRGKESLGRRRLADPVAVAKWRQENKASITQVMAEFGLSKATAKRYMATAKK